MKPHILVIDDDVSLLEVMEILLSSYGFVVTKCADSTKAFEMAKLVKPQAIIVDSVMPKVSGNILAAEFKNDAELGNVPILLLTPHAAMAGSIPLKMPTKYVLHKPFNSDGFLDAVYDMLTDSWE